jgi:biopolymer transport protein ExbD
MQVIIKADREVPHGFVQEVARTVNGVEGVKFYVGVQDKKGG